ncbi:xanthine dehydrogenase family protein molybdopterin-binding subunit [Croceicoccus sp. F390]|uniref:Xanthine dehydrogenase family protein molybdopterin-binding subunit n=1 Tax=Croceicoccus esteveae TaxID=3075597 RepID=A0ABU2ZKJ6_9SPHN|nr:xanthine dehydrogenase family protein molybdopterin-binding subunit [Croceicoccus sp. F390]MDT0577117.1 xanthine dehydrogenase family protein molybdopterin-binding subunit [Croceicoccus sp. F390]
MPTTAPKIIGYQQNRVDGPMKVTGGARYAAEFTPSDLHHGYVVCSPVARGTIRHIDATAAMAFPGVVEVFTHENRPDTAWMDRNYQDQVAPPGHPFRPLYDDRVLYSGQPIALVIADSFEAARDAAALVRIEIKVADHQTDIMAAQARAYVPPKGRFGISGPPSSRGDFGVAFAGAPVRIDADYRVAVEHHNPMEPHATTVEWMGDGAITVHDKIQGVMNSQKYVTGVFGMKAKDVHVVTPFVGGGFGSGLRPQYQLFLAVMAATALKRSVRVVLTRDQMWTHVHRPHTLQTVKLGATTDGRLTALSHEAIAGTSTFEDHQEVVVNWSGMLYHCPNAEFSYRLAQLDTYTPSDMRAPGAALGLFALESAMDELAQAVNIDPVELRLRNYSEKDENRNKRFSSKALRACYEQGGQAFEWSRRSPEPRSVRDGRELVGMGMATGVWEARTTILSARATLRSDGTLNVATASADIGTGTYTILAQIAAETMGLDIGQVSANLGDSDYPASPVEGGSWTAASAGNAVRMACEAVRSDLLSHARTLAGSPLNDASEEDVIFANGRIMLKTDHERSVTYADVLKGHGLDRLEAEKTNLPHFLAKLRYVGYTHSAVFAEVRVDEQLGQVRVTRLVIAAAAGRILNPQTARSQIMGAAVMAIGKTLEEETFTDHRFGRFMNHNLAEYHIPVNADVDRIDVIFVDEEDDALSSMDVKGLGELGIVGTGAAIANAIFNATGRRIRDLPITLDKLL